MNETGDDRRCALQLCDLHKRFGATPIIRGVSLDIRDGERHAIIGPNGAGKSTLFNLISGRFAPTTGSIRLHGEAIEGHERSRSSCKGLAAAGDISRLRRGRLRAR